jgi:hypothetical protein
MKCLLDSQTFVIVTFLIYRIFVNSLDVNDLFIFVAGTK